MGKTIRSAKIKLTVRGRWSGSQTHKGTTAWRQCFSIVLLIVVRWQERRNVRYCWEIVRERGGARLGSTDACSGDTGAILTLNSQGRNERLPLRLPVFVRSHAGASARTVDHRRRVRRRGKSPAGRARH